MLLRFLFFAFICGLFPLTVHSSSDIYEWANGEDKLLSAWSKQLDQWNEHTPGQHVVTARLNQVIEMRKDAENCEIDLSDRLQGLNEKIAALGEGTEISPLVSDEIVAKRSELTSKRTVLERDLALCRLLAVNALELRDNLNLMRQQAFSRALLEQLQPVWQVIPAVISKPPTITLPKHQFFTLPAIAGGIITLGLLLPLSLFFSRLLITQYVTPNATKRRSKLTSMYAARLPWMALVASVGLIAFMTNASPAVMICLALIVSLALAPLLDLLVCHPELRCAEGKSARILFDLFLFGAAWLLMDFSHEIPVQIDALTRAIFMLLLAWSATWLVHRLSLRDDFQTLSSLKLPLMMSLLLGPFSYWYGYRVLGEFLVTGIYGSLAGVLVIWLFYGAVKEGFTALEDQNSSKANKIRRYLGYKPTDRIPGFGLLKLSFWFLIIASTIYWLLLVWQVSDADKTLLSELVQQGFNVGAINIVPARIMAALFSLIILITLAQWIRKQLDERWLSKTKINAGARQSIVSLTSYAIIGIAIAVTLSMAGVNLQNLAIIAGALSVGIGFGLQNIVNNFVSGLILLLERPVRPGDWIVVGGTEGYVKKISIRSTLIQTFDRADVLVPNSELISNQVTNWMLRDSMGRVIVPLSVAYGSDTEKVKSLLLEISSKHPLVICNDWICPVPKVYFISFGDSALNFELRCFIRDVDTKLSVRSDLLFAIDKAFREEGIEMPFPQRVIHQSNK